MILRALDWVVDSFTSVEPLAEASRTAATKARWDFLAEPDLTTSYEILRDISNGARGNHTAARRAMASLLVSRETREEDIDIRKITALGASKGRYVGNLRRLLATISEPPKAISNLPREEQLTRVRDDVWREFGNKIGDRFTIVEEGWSGRLIGMNTGAARRFSMLHCECRSEPLLFPARIERMEFEPGAFTVLTTDHWLIMLPEDTARQFQAAAEAAKVEGVVEFSRVRGHGCPDDGEQVGWTVLACPTVSRRYRDFRLAIEDAAVPRFDLSHWLRLLAKGRAHP